MKEIKIPTKTYVDDEINKKIKKLKIKWAINTILDYVNSILFAVFIILLGIALAARIVESIKIDSKIQQPEKCIEINNKYYCEVEGK